jgi:peptidylprolyl isomerase
MPTTIRPLLLALLAALALTLAACGGGGDEEPAQPASTQAAPADTQPAAQDQATASGEISKDLKEKPAIAKPEGSPPSELQSEDIVKGDGQTARKGDNVTVQYVGVNWSDGQEFDASWNTGQPFTFTLGSGQVIPGWDEGVAGMKVGGRRKLVIPPDMAYGPQGSPPVIKPNETLVFVVDLQGVQRGQ